MYFFEISNYLFLRNFKLCISSKLRTIYFFEISNYVFFPNFRTIYFFETSNYVFLRNFELFIRSNFPGSIDEVDQVVHVTWVQPRVLDLNQVQNVNFYQLT